MNKTTHQYEAFKQLHQLPVPLLLGNVWSAQSARIAEKTGYEALGSSSHAIANMLGYEDGEEISFEELFFIVRSIRNAVKIPLSVDFEAGYSEDPDEVARMVREMAEAGVSGINLEDSLVTGGERRLGDASLLAEKIKAVKGKCAIFINARTDTYTTNHEQALEESVRRAGIYASAGADGIFVPLIESGSDIQEFVAQVSLPLNVFITPGLPAYDQLAAWGVKRVSHGAKQYEYLMKRSEEIFTEYRKTKRYASILNP